MKKLLLILIIIAYSTSYAQNTKLKAISIKDKYENIFYKTPAKYNNKEQKFNVNSIEYHTSYIASKSEYLYQILIEGKVKNTKERILHIAKSIEELEYYKNVFQGRYKKILLYQNSNKVGGTTYYNTSIVVEY
jgi:phage-related holin